MNIFQVFAIYLGRFFLSSIFLISAIQEMLDWASTEQYFLMSINRWAGTFQGNEVISGFITSLFPWLPWFLLAAVVFKIVGSFLMILGFNVRLGATLLILFIVPATLIVHCFWSLPPQESALEAIMFMKNVSILGGLLVVLAFGRGKSVSKGA